MTWYVRKDVCVVSLDRAELLNFELSNESCQKSYLSGIEDSSNSMISKNYLCSLD